MIPAALAAAALALLSGCSLRQGTTGPDATYTYSRSAAGDCEVSITSTRDIVRSQFRISPQCELDVTVSGFTEAEEAAQVFKELLILFSE